MLADTTIEQIQKALAPLAEKLGEGAKYAWYVYYRQTIVEAIIELVFVVIFLGVAITLAIVAYKTGKTAYLSRKKVETSRLWTAEENVKTMICFLSSASSVLLFIFAAANLHEGLTHLINPGYYTINRILTQFVH